MRILPPLAAILYSVISLQAAAPPSGFVSLFNETDFNGWRAGGALDHIKLQAMPEDARQAEINAWTAALTAIDEKTGTPHWRIEGDQMVNDGMGYCATTEKDYGDFELALEYKATQDANCGVLLRGIPQVGLWSTIAGDAAAMPGEWNKLRIIIVGSRMSAWLNDKQVIDHAILANSSAPPNPLPARGPIQLKTHGGEMRWRNLFIREIGGEEANRVLASHGKDGFTSVFNGKDFTGWAGSLENYETVDGSICCKEKKGGTVYFNEEIKDFQVRLEYNVPPGGNNGLAIRYPGEGNTAYTGMTEIQVLDDDAPNHANLDVRQYSGSAYGMVAAHRGYTRPAGEWNFEEVTVKGSTIRVELNGTVILDADLSKVDMATVMHDAPHPGKDRTSGYFGFAGHRTPVRFRNIALKPLTSP